MQNEKTVSFHIMQIEHLVKNMHVSFYPQKSSLVKPTQNSPPGYGWYLGIQSKFPPPKGI